MKLTSIPANPVPEGATLAMLRTVDGVALRTAHWPPPPGRRGTVCVLQGRAEFIEKYFDVVRDLRARGFAVAMLDWRGQGGSGRALADARKGHVASFSQYETDLATFMKQVVLPDCPPPYFAIAHSTGAAVLLRAAHSGARWFDRSVLTSPLIALAHARLLGIAAPLARVLKCLGLGSSYVPGGSATVISAQPFAGNILTSDPVRYARVAAVIEAEPALALGSPTIAWANAAFKAMAEFAKPAYPAAIRQPILIVASGRDRIISTPAIEEFAIHMRAGSQLVVAGAQHEILMELDSYRMQFWAAFDAFVPGTPMY